MPARPRRHALLAATVAVLAVAPLLAAAPASATGCATHFAGRGTGTPADPYQVGGLTDIVQVNSCLGASFRQTNAVGITPGWVPIGSAAAPFTGRYDGGGNLVVDLALNGAAADQGLFGVIGGSAVVTNMIVMGDISGTGDRVGLLAGSAGAALIDNVTVIGTVTGGNDVGGLVGHAEGALVSNSTSEATVAGTGNHVGGVVGYAQDLTLTHATAKGNVTGGGSHIGGVAGYAKGASRFTDVKSVGDIAENGDGVGAGLGGVVGSVVSDAFLENSELIGLSSVGTVTTSVPAGMSGWDGLGGVIGSINAAMGDVAMTTSRSSSPVTARANAQGVGGLVGRTLAGENRAVDITQSRATGWIVGGGTSAGVGGLVGITDTDLSRRSMVSDSYATGNVSGGAGVGGAFGVVIEDGDGVSDVIIQHVYSRGQSAGVSLPTVGGLVGSVTGSPSDNGNYWDIDWSGQNTSAMGVGKTSQQMRTRSTYVGWVFGRWGGNGSVWGACAEVTYGYPYLQTFESSPQCPEPATAPRNPAATVTGSTLGTALVGWTAPLSDGGAAITGYSVTASPSGRSCTAPMPGPLECTVGTPADRLPPGPQTFTVVATNPVGAGDPASVTLTMPNVPDRPRTVSAAVLADGTVGVTWSPPASDGGAPVTGFVVSTSPATTDTLVGVTSQATLTLPPGTYNVYVTAANQVGSSSMSEPANVTVPAPGTPTDPTSGTSGTGGTGGTGDTGGQTPTGGTGGTGQTPSGTDTTVAQVQQPVRPLDLPSKIKRRTVLLPEAVKTNAGQTATSTLAVTGAPKAARKAIRVKRSDRGGITIVVSRAKTSGKPRLTLSLNAPAANGYGAYAFTRTWTVHVPQSQEAD